MPALALQAPDTQPDPADPLRKKPPVAAGAPLPSPSGGAAPLTLAQPAGASQGPAGAMTPPPMTPPSTEATPANRLQLATDAFNASAASTQGAYDAASRDNVHNSAALGQVGSGGLRTREGNLQLARGRDLDALRSKLVTDAAVGSIEDQRAAEAQKIAQQNADTARIGTTGNLDVAKGGLELAKTGQERTFGLEGEKLALAKEGQTAQIGQTQQQIDLAKKTADINAAYQSGQLSLAQKDQALRELAQAQGNALATGQLELAKSGQEQQGQQEAARLQLAKDQLAQTGAQFGLSLAQQKELAVLADKTQNRQVDLSQQGLALELARIMGADVPANFLAEIAKALGYALPQKKGDTTVVTPTVHHRSDGSEIKPGDSDYQDTKIPVDG